MVRCLDGGWTFYERMMLMRDMSRLACKVILSDVYRYLIASEIEMRMLFWHFSLEAIMYNHLLGVTLCLLLGKHRNFFPPEVVVMDGVLSLLDDMRNNLIDDYRSAHHRRINYIFIEVA